MAGTPAPLRRTPLALATALVLIAGTLAVGMAGASATGAIRKFSPTLTPDTSCVAVGSVHRFTATITNSSSSNQPLGSALFHSSTSNGFYNIFASSFTTPVATGGKTWQAVPDTVDADGVYLKATSSSQALSPGQSVTMTFEAKAPSTAGIKTWSTFAWQGTNFLSSSFSFATGASNPKITVSTTCVGPAANIAFVTGPSDTTAGGTLANVTVKVTDASSNPISGASVTLSSAGLATTPSAPQSTNGSGVATFSGLAVSTVAGPYSMTASSGALTTGTATFNVTAGAPIVTFTNQPTDTLVDATINGSAGVEVTAQDSHGNPVSGLAITLSISPNSFATGGALTGGGPVSTGPDGVATFSGLSIDLSSSGYKLQTDGGVDSDAFAITNTDDSCTSNCTAEFPDGGTVSAPAGTTLIIENNDLVTCDGAVSNAVAGTVTIIPDPNGPNQVDITFVDPFENIAPVEVGKAYPMCKGGPGFPDGRILGSCDTDPVPCVLSQTLQVGPLDLHTVIRITQDDPPVRH